MLNLRRQSPLVCTLLLILLIAVASFVASRRINTMEEQQSLDMLYQAARIMAREIENQVVGDRKQLEMLARTAASFADLRDPELWEILNSYTTVGMMAHLSLLLPDGTVRRSTMQEFHAGDALPFEALAAQGAHLSGRERSLVNGRHVLRHFVPVVRDGKTVAMLYGTVDLRDLPGRLLFRPYGGAAAVYVVDGETGDFLLDTWHSDLTNMWALGDRPMAQGYTMEAFRQAIADGQTGHALFRSRTSGNYLYYLYAPLGINQWRLGLSVQDVVVFARANRIRHILNAFLLFECACFLGHLLWMVRYVRRETGEKQHQVDTINNTYDVAKLLFSAHEHQEHIALALERTARNTGGSAAVFWVADLGESGLFFAWPSAARAAGATAPATAQPNPSYIPVLLRFFGTGEKCFEAHTPAELSPVFPKGVPADLTGMAAIPLEDTGGHFCGILAVENPWRGQDTYALLRSVSFSFGMLGQNLRHVSAIRARGETDALTGLWNRNRYERDLPDCRQWYRDSLACVYIDANGLHELNNARGHEAGDGMLRSIAAEIVRRFGREHSYRIGGDEFVVFVADTAREDVASMCREMEQSLLTESIHVSVGCQWAEDIAGVGDFIKAAEQEMYAAKRSYYADRAHDRRKFPR